MQIPAPNNALQRTSPINKLPLETLHDIFKLGVSCRNSQKRIDFAVLVSHVCRKWRNVAISSSSLWTDITITSDNMHDVDSDVQLAIVNKSLIRAREFAFRSGVFPLFVRLKLLTIHNSKVLRSGTGIIMDWLRLVLPRIKYLSIKCNSLEVAWIIMSRLRAAPMENLETYKMKFGTTFVSFDSTIPLLPTLRFRILASGHEEQFAQVTDNLLPRLTRATYSGIPVSWPQWSLTRLTSLTINFMALNNRPSMDTLKNILTINGETLEKLEIKGAIQRFGRLPDVDELPSNLPRLIDLTLGYLSQQEAITFLLHFETPALKHLKLCDVSRSILARPRPRRLNNQDFQNMDALRPFSNFSSTEILEHLVYVWAPQLQRVETLVLEHFRLPPVFSALLQDDDFLNQQRYDGRVFLAYRMLQTCLRLRSLVLVNPEECLIHALNIYPDPDDPRPAPVLTRLCLASAHRDLLILFLKQRAESLAEEKGSHVLDYLELATAEQDVEHLSENIASNCIDMSRFAESSLVTEWQGSLTT
ncbi:uncharacterized protein EDB93DRAFT_1311537 [Suillus bovinus]|uniref:uncharacterized protein n=1 Tax=Suillus bovinus TaxID=48563 RepID=UPI001B87CCCE|nr:uncharacterized protein EDB93DRAFT_1311537 [Suillus bovinus]KAG2131620.1 hypothetical protein EDB93DRAFT_1311537 [Suillus bovinus]